MGQDVRYALRLLRKSPGFAAVVVLTLALGIGTNSAVFSVVRGAILQPLPYRDPARLVDVLDASARDPNLSHTFATYADFEEYARHARSFEKIAFATWANAGAKLTGRGPARGVLAIPVSQDFFAMLGVTAALGRTFLPGDMSGDCPVVLSDSFWRSTLAGDPHIVGQSLELNGRACIVTGVLPARFEFYPRQTNLWMLFTPADPRPRDRFPAITFGRLKPGVTAAQAQSELAALHRQMSQPDWQRDFVPAVHNLQDEFTFLAGRNLRATLVLLLVAVGLVLLIACLNVANLLLARSWARAKEFAVRAALGSGRARLVRQLLVEGLLLAAMGGIAGVAIALALVKYFVYANPIELPIGSDISVNFPVLLFTAFLTMATALVFGMAPAWSGSRTDPGAGLRAAGRGAISGGNRRFASALIAVEISLSLMLLAGAGLLMRSVLKFGSADLGFDPDHVMATRSSLPERRYTSPADQSRFFDELRSRLNAIPGVETSAFAANIPPYAGGSAEVEVEGRGRAGPMDTNTVGEDYFSVLRIALRRGRLFTREDVLGAETVAVVSEEFANEYFPGADAIGRRVRVWGEKDAPWLTIVGVVATERHPELLREMSWHASAELYRPLRQQPVSSFAIVVRTRGEQADTGRAMARAMSGSDAELPVGEIFALRESLGMYLKYPRFRAVVLDQFAALALLLAGLGLHGLLSQYVAQRTREIGLRMAIGARTRDILRLIAIQGGAPLGAGMLLGMAATAELTRYLSSLLFEVTPGDPLTMIAAPMALLAVSLVAMARPALTASAIDPLVALRDE
ncbi:MAG TPA: ABC transporter permease [Bryobacteraceae bacterium]|nr:ABC transporter permease [Bryobacteraceae bacterium]